MVYFLQPYRFPRALEKEARNETNICDYVGGRPGMQCCVSFSHTDYGSRFASRGNFAFEADRPSHDDGSQRRLRHVKVAPKAVDRRSSGEAASATVRGFRIEN